MTSSNTRLGVLIGIILILMGVIFFGLYESRPVLDTNWKKDYSKESKYPYGTWLFHNVLKTQYSEASFNEGMPDTSLQTTDRLYIRIADIGSKQQPQIDSLKTFLHQGNTAVIISNSTGGAIDSLLPDGTYGYMQYSNSINLNFVEEEKSRPQGYQYIQYNIELDTAKKGLRYFNYYFDDEVEHDQGIAFIKRTLTFPSLFGEDYNDEEDNYTDYDEQDAESVEEPETTENEEIENSNYGEYIIVKNSIGESGGTIYFCTVPDVFSNIALQQLPVAEFVDKLLVDIPSPSIVYFDDAPGKYIPDIHNFDSPLQFILSQRSLKWAYYMSMLGILLFMIFRSRRRQKVIPLRNEKQNTSLEYIGTVSKMYLAEEQHSKLAKHLEKIFYHNVEKKYFITKDHPDFIHQVAKKARVTEDDIRTLINRFDQIKTGQQISKYQLQKITERIENIL